MRKRNLSERYRVLIRQYRDPPKGKSASADLYHELATVERLLIDHPPKLKTPDGRMVVRAKGLITPEEARAGADAKGLSRLRKLGTPECNRIRDDFKVIAVGDWADAIAERQKQKAESRRMVEDFTLDQNGYGSCGSEGIAGCIIGCERKQGNPNVERLNAFRLYKYVNGGRDNGSSLPDNLAAAAEYGVPTETVSPRTRGWKEKITDEEREDALRHRLDEYWQVSNKEELGTALLLGMFVYLGYAGHAFNAVDLVDDKRLVWHNSWGEEFGDNGFSTLLFDDVYWSYGVYAVRTALRPSVN